MGGAEIEKEGCWIKDNKRWREIMRKVGEIMRKICPICPPSDVHKFTIHRHGVVTYFDQIDILSSLFCKSITAGMPCTKPVAPNVVLCPICSIDADRKRTVTNRKDKSG